jgi:hypothetical protein
MGVDNNKILLTKKSDEITEEDIEELKRQGYQVDIQGFLDPASVKDEEKDKKEEAETVDEG